MKHKIFVVDDHPVIRKGYHFLMSHEPDLEVCGEAGSALDAMERLAQTTPDLVVVDLSLHGMSGLELIKHLHAQQPDLPILVVSTHDESQYGERALRAGARGYIMKSEADTVIVTAIRRILRGGIYLSDEMGAKLLLQYQRGATPGEMTSPLQRLSDRELEVFELMGKGYTTKQIAEALMISPKTVGSHRGRIKQKLAIASTPQLLRRATLWVDRQP